MKHVIFPAIGGAVAVLVLTSHSFTRHAHLTHVKEYIAAGVIVVAVDLILVAVSRAFKPKPPAAPPRRPGYTSTRF